MLSNHRDETLVLLLHGVDPVLWSHRLSAERSILGRSPTCAVRLPHPSVSRLHAEIWPNNGTFYVRDLKSCNGTFLNGGRILESVLTVGDVLHVAEVKLDVVAASTMATVPDMEFDTPVPFRSESDSPVAESPPRNGTPSSFLTLGAQPEQRDGALSPSEQRVLSFLLKGLSEKEIATQLHLSGHTVHSHVKSIYRALDVHSRAELMSRFLGGSEIGNFGDKTVLWKAM